MASLWSSWDWAERHGIPDPFEHPCVSTGIQWHPADPDVWGYWPADAARGGQRLSVVHFCYCL